MAQRAAHLEGFVAARVGLLLPQSRGLLVGCRQLVPLEHQRLLKLLLRLGLQQLLPEGDVREEGGERPAQLHRRLGAFLQRSRRTSFCVTTTITSNINVNLTTTKLKEADKQTERHIYYPIGWRV